MASKRSAKTTAASAPATKRAKANPNFAGVVQALKVSKLPVAVRDMLIASVPTVLGTPHPNRHNVQNEVASMIKEALFDVRASLEASVKEAAAHLEALRSSHGERTGKFALAEGELRNAVGTAEERKRDLAAATQKMHAARAEVVEKTRAKDTHAKKLEQAAELLARFEEVAASHLAPLCRGAWGEEGAQRHLEAAQPVLAGLSLEGSLVAAMPLVCVKASAERTAFDAMVMESLSRAVEARGAELRGEKEALEAAAAELEGPARDAQEALDSAQADVNDRAEALAAALSAQTAAKDAVAASEQALASFEPELQGAMQRHRQCSEQLEEYDAYNLCCFETLNSTADCGP